jgi:hypothetical protein
MRDIQDLGRTAKSAISHKPFGGAGEALAEARRLMPLDLLMARFGHPCPSQKKSSFPCPFCGKKKANLRKHHERLWFKCFNPACTSGTFGAHQSFDEVAFIGFIKGLSCSNGGPGHYSEAAIAFMKFAGTWRDNAAPSGEVVEESTNAASDPALANTSPPNGAFPDLESTQPPLDASFAVGDVFERSGYRALIAFFGQLKLSEDDEHRLFEKRGLTSVTVKALRFRSNPRENQHILEQLALSHGWPELIRAGLASPADPKRKLGDRANTQFCGKGHMGKIPKHLRQHPDLKVKWGWTFPILIPYFDAAGNLDGLRPHKGGAAAGTAAGNGLPYVPRAAEASLAGPEKFERVVITEGEFKAAALWQTVGLGARQFSGGFEAYGVCSLPGISFVRNVEARAALEEWLQTVSCREIIVAFDREEKGDPNLLSYEDDPARRYDALVYAVYLALDLSQKLHIRGRVCLLPKTWMNAQGKADWDGALAAIAHSKLE